VDAGGSQATRVRIYLGEADRHDGRPLYHELVMRARRAGIAGVTVVRGIEGYGASSRVRTASLLDLSSDLPVVVEMVDETARIEAFLPDVLAAVRGGLVTRERVEVLHYADAGGAAGQPPARP